MMMKTRACTTVLALLAALSIPGSAEAQSSCEGITAYDRLDFWLGEWSVRSGGREAGTNRITKILGGCAVQEEWIGATGGEGRSLFYYHPREEEWRQVWVTSTSFRTGGVKEKTLLAVTDDGALRFQGRVVDEAGVAWLDRTTLTPLPEGRVRQLIEISPDGMSWETVFDAVYEPLGDDG